MVFSWCSRMGFLGMKKNNTYKNYIYIYIERVFWGISHTGPHVGIGVHPTNIFWDSESRQKVVEVFGSIWNGNHPIVPWKLDDDKPLLKRKWWNSSNHQPNSKNGGSALVDFQGITICPKQFRERVCALFRVGEFAWPAIKGESWPPRRG